MPALNSQTHYGGVAKWLHWLTVILMLMLFPSGYVAHGLPFETAEQLADKAGLFQIHKTLGITVFFLAVLRILWALTQEKPRPLHPDRKLETFAAEIAHWVLYGSIILVPLTGWIHHAATEGFAPILWPFGQSLPFVPKSEGVAVLFSTLHFFLMLLLGVTILAHVGGALKHLVIDRGKTLQRMLPGRPDIADPAENSPSRLPLLVAIMAFAVVGGYAVIEAQGRSAGRTTEAETTPIAALESGNWKVTEGSLTITITQFGRAVTGEFAEWHANINFDETVDTGHAGNVEVEIVIASLTLGSVTDQALGTDYFDAPQFPTATFNADIISDPESQEAQGMLEIRGVEQPIRFPFDLEIDGDTARMGGTLRLQRLDFGIGANMPDESTLGFAVDVLVELDAKRAE